MIDSHLHINFRNFGAKELQSYIEKFNISQVWLLSWEQYKPKFYENYLHLKPEDIYKIKQTLGEKVKCFYCPDPRDPKACEKLEYWKNMGFDGCGELKSRSQWKSPYLDLLLDKANKLEMPIIFHMENQKKYKYIKNIYILDFIIEFLHKLNYRFMINKYTRLLNMFDYLITSIQKFKVHYFTSYKILPGFLNDIDGLEDKLIKFPNLKFIGHGPAIWKYILDDAKLNISPSTDNKILRLLKTYSNFYIDISAKSGFKTISYNKTYTNNFCNFLSNKILYGTDNFFLNQRDFINDLDICDTIKQKIFLHNSQSIFS